jgi:hypothetical protein
MISQELPEAGFRAKITVVDAPPSMEAGVPTTVRARVRNESEATWWAMADGEGRCHVRVGNHWLDRQGKDVLVHEDGRVILPTDLAPGQEADVSLTVTPPADPGRYVLEVDVVQEGVTWFKDRGSPTVRTPAFVKAARRRAAKSPAPSAPVDAPPVEPTWEPTMEMHGIPQNEVIALVEGAGGRVLNVRTARGGDWLHGFYTVRKPG